MKGRRRRRPVAARKKESAFARALGPIGRLRRTIRKLPLWLDALFSCGIMLLALATIVIIQQRSGGTAGPAAPRIRSDVSATAPSTFLDDAPGSGAGHFSYVGTWDHISGENDGRREGTSSRSTQIGAMASFQFTGNRLELFGVRGPNGGTATLRLDGKAVGSLSFYAAHKDAGARVYENTKLTLGPHSVEIIVMPPAIADSNRRFVNLDGARFGSP